jgi:hypothetical protein
MNAFSSLFAQDTETGTSGGVFSRLQANSEPPVSVQPVSFAFQPSTTVSESHDSHTGGEHTVGHTHHVEKPAVSWRLFKRAVRNTLRNPKVFGAKALATAFIISFIIGPIVPIMPMVVRAQEIAAEELAASSDNSSNTSVDEATPAETAADIPVPTDIPAGDTVPVEIPDTGVPAGTSDPAGDQPVTTTGDPAVTDTANGSGSTTVPSNDATTGGTPDSSTTDGAVLPTPETSVVPESVPATVDGTVDGAEVPVELPAGEVLPLDQTVAPVDTVIVSEDTVIDADLRIAPVAVIADNQIRIKLADWNIPGKEEGDKLSDREAFATILGITTKKKDLNSTTAAPVTPVETQKQGILGLLGGTDTKTIDIADYANISSDTAKIEAVVEDVIKDGGDIGKYIEISATPKEVITTVTNADGTTSEKTITPESTQSIQVSGDDISFISGSIIMQFPLRDAAPGTYTVSGTILNPITGDETSFSQDFTWGVLSMNLDQNVYTTGETANLSIGVLDDAGVPVCDAVNTLEIVAPNGNVENVTPINTGKCTEFDANNVVPDYSYDYVFNQSGVYTFRLTSDIGDGAGSKTLEKTVIIDNASPFVVERIMATRLYPVGNSVATVTISFNEAFSGNITELLPADFTIVNSSAVLTRSSQSDSSSTIISAPAPEVVVEAPVVTTPAPVVVDVPAGETIVVDPATGTPVVQVGDENPVEPVVSEEIPSETTEVTTPGSTPEESLVTSEPVAPAPAPTPEPEPVETQSVLENIIQSITDIVAPNVDADDFTYSTVVGSTDNGQTIATQNISAVAGDKLVISYTYDAPDISPMYYTVGGLSFTNNDGIETYNEGRTWGIANDNPVEVPDTNLALWLRADKNIYSDTAYSTPVTAGGTVGSWKDQSVNVNSYAQSTAGERPTYRDGTYPTAINYQPTLFFDGANDNLQRTTFLNNTTGGTVFAVGRINTTTSSWNTLFQQDGSNGNNPMWGIYDNQPYFYDTNSTPSVVRSPQSITLAATQIYGFQWGVPGTNSGWTSYLDGVKGVTDNTLDMGFGTGQLQLSDDTTEGWDGQMSEVIVYKEQLSDANREKIESYLAIKYGTTLSQNGTLLANAPQSGNGFTAAAPSTLGQTFVPTASGSINALSVMAYSTNTATAATVYMCDTSVSATATSCIAAPGATGTLTLPNAPTQYTTATVQFATPFAVTSGTEYVFHIKPTSGTLALIGSTTDYYSGGVVYSNDTPTASQDLGFSAFSYATGGRDYVASNGSVVFDASDSIDTTVNSSSRLDTSVSTTSADDYVYNVHAIAKDNAQLLVSTKSRSESEVTPFLTTEIENSSLLDDREFMFVGSTSAAATSIVNTDMPASGLPTYTNYRTAREWRVQKNAVINGVPTADPAMGTFKLTFDLDAMNISVSQARGMRVVVDDNGVFTAGTQTVYPTTGEPTYDALTNSVSFTGISLADGQYFTLAIPRLVPGGVATGLRAWFRADAGTYNTSTLASQAVSTDNSDMAYWKDVSGNAYHLSTQQSNPDFRSATNDLAINYNPVVDFENANNDILITPSTLGGGVWGTSGSTVPNIESYQVIKQETYGSASHSGLWGGQNSTEFITGLSNTDLYFQSGGSIQVPFSTLGSSLNTPYMYGTQGYSTGTAHKSIQQNGKTVVQNTTFSSLTTNTTRTYVGSYTTDEQNYDGVVGDLIFYAAQNSAADKNKINSYLAVKYGLTMSGGESQLTHDSNAATGNAVGQLIVAKTSANITQVTFRTDSATPNTASGNLMICTGAITTLPNSTNVANCIGAPAYSQAITIPTALSTNFSTTLSVPFPISAGSTYAILVTGTNVRLRSNSADIYATGVGFNTSGSISPQDLYFDYVTDSSDYTASNGSTEMWNKGLSGAINYQNGIAIVGRDDTSNLWQTKSKSQTVTGNPIVEIADTTAVADMEFMAVAGNTGALGAQTIDLPTGLPALTNARFIREWQVQKAGDVGLVNISIDMGEHSVGAVDMTKVKLLTDADGTFAAGSTISTITPTISGTVITFSGVAFTQGQYFTVAFPNNSRGPGGVTNGLKLWTRADRDVYTDVAGTTAATIGSDINRIKDQSGGGNDFIDHASGGAPKLVLTTLGTQTSGAYPNYVTPNYQPMLQFCRISDSHGFFSGYTCTADNDYMYDPTGILGNSTYSDVALYTFAADKYAATNDGVFGEAPGLGTYQEVTNGNHYADLGNTVANQMQAGMIGTLSNSRNTYAMFSMIGSTTDDGDGTIGQRTKKNGRFVSGASDATFGTFTGTNSPSYLGAQAGAASPMHGRIGEIIAYAQNGTTQTPAETQRIESYMAMKYGITLGNTDTIATIDEGAYVLSDGTTVVWDGSIDAGTLGVDRGFHNGVAGMVRDDGSDLYTKIGRSYSTDEVLSIALDNNFTAANNATARVGTFAADKSAVMWGHSGHSVLFDTATSTTNTNVRMGRFWKVKMTTVATQVASLQFKNDAVMRVKNGLQYVLLESTSATFAAPTELATATAASGEIVFSGVTLTSGRYYTIGTKLVAPGGVTSKMIQGVRATIYVENETSDSFHASSQLHASNITGVESVGTGTQKSAPIMTSYINQVQSGGTTGGVSDGQFDDNRCRRIRRVY